MAKSQISQAVGQRHPQGIIKGVVEIKALQATGQIQQLVACFDTWLWGCFGSVPKGTADFKFTKKLENCIVIAI